LNCNPAVKINVALRYRLWPARRSSCRWPRPIRSCWSGSPGWRCAAGGKGRRLFHFGGWW